MKTNTLTPRERQVLELTAFGSSQKEAADHLNISRYTVDVHLKHIKEKTGLHKVAELTALYFSKRYKIPSMDFPEKLRRTLAAALLMLSVFTCILNTSDLLRTRTARRGRRNKTELIISI